jgi:thioesterase domain-containing protein
MNTRTIDILLEIMADSGMSTHRRIEAAEGLLGFEAPAEAANRAREYLAQVGEDKENETISDRMDALQILRKFEAKKIAPQTVHITRRAEADRREAWREYERMRLRTELILATRDHPPKGWDAALRSPDYVPPPGDAWPPAGGLKKRDG